MSVGTAPSKGVVKIDQKAQEDLFKQTVEKEVAEASGEPAQSMHTMTFDNSADAPACDTCGSIMVRNAACYKCLNCGATSGCS